MPSLFVVALTDDFRCMLMSSSYLACRDELQRPQGALHVGNVGLELVQRRSDAGLDFGGLGPRWAVGRDLVKRLLRHGGGVCGGWQSGREMSCAWLQCYVDLRIFRMAGQLRKCRRGLAKPAPDKLPPCQPQSRMLATALSSLAETLAACPNQPEVHRTCEAVVVEACDEATCKLQITLTRALPSSPSPSSFAGTVAQDAIHNSSRGHHRSGEGGDLHLTRGALLRPGHKKHVWKELARHGMNGSKSPDVPVQWSSGSSHHGHVLPNAPATTNGHRSPHEVHGKKTQSSPVPSGEGPDTISSGNHAPASAESVRRHATNGGDEDANSEAETLIDSPVKKKEAEKQKAVVKPEKPAKSRIGSLPVPGDDDDDDADSASSPMESTEMSIGKATSSGDVHDQDVEMMDEGSGKDADGSDDSLSSVRSSPDNAPSRETSRSPTPTFSERADFARNATSNSPNPKKRKHRASSVTLPNKRQSMDPPKRTLRGIHSEDNVGRAGRSPSPRPSGHRRAVSTQSALDGTADANGRKRRSGQFSVRDPKLSKWEESDASSETTSRGQDENKRPQRGIGRSTSTPGRPVPREHKRHVNKYGFTRFAEACEAGDLDLVKQWREKDPDQLELAEFAGNKPLQIAALNGNAEVVEYLIDQGCQIDCANVDRDTPLIDAAENGHLEVVNLLLSAGVDPLRQNLKGQQALDVITDDEDDASAIRAALHAAIDRWSSTEARKRREEEEEQRHRFGPSKELQFMARTYENMVQLVQNNDRNGVREFLDSRVPVDNALLGVAAKTGDLYLVNMLAAEMTEKKARSKPEKPMLCVLGTSHFDMVTSLTELDHFDPLWQNRQGRTWAQQAEDKQGPHWKQEKELLQRLYDQRVGAGGTAKGRGSSSPVTKRENGKRRLHVLQQTNDDSDDDQETAPRRKNGRRLMSRKDIRAAGGGKNTLSDSSDEYEEEENSTSDSAPALGSGSSRVLGRASTEREVGDASMSMKPPESPNSRRQQGGRLRSKSTSSHNSETTAPQQQLLRRRSSSLRGSLQEGAVLPTVEEKASDESEEATGAQKVDRQREEEERMAREEAQRLEAKRKEEADAAAEVERAKEAQARIKAEEDRKAADLRKVEEERERQLERARLAEEAMKAEQVRRAEQAQKAEEERKEEEARRVEQANRAEEERRREIELAEAKKQHSDLVLAALPPFLADILRLPRDAAAPLDEILRYFASPFHIFASEADEGQELWVSNLQAAPLLGGKGLELFLRDRAPGFEGSLADLCTTQEIRRRDLMFLDPVIMNMPNEGTTPDEFYDEAGNNTQTFSEQDEMAAKRLAHYHRYRDALAPGPSGGEPAVLRRVKLEDFLSRLPEEVKEAEVTVQVVSATRWEWMEMVRLEDTPEFVQRVKEVVARAKAPPVFQSTPVVVVHEK